MFSSFVKVLEIPVSLHKHIEDDNLLVLNSITTIYIIDRNDIVYTNLGHINLLQIQSTVINEKFYFGHDCLAYHYLKADVNTLLSETNTVIKNFNRKFLDLSYLSKKLIVKLEKIEENNYKLVYYYNKNIVNNFLNGNVTSYAQVYLLSYLIDKNQKYKILCKSNDELNNILNTTKCKNNISVEMFDEIFENVFENVELYNYQKSDIIWMKELEQSIIRGENVITYQQLFSYNLYYPEINEEYLISHDLKKIKNCNFMDINYDENFVHHDTYLHYYGGNIISEVGLGKTLIVLFAILSDNTYNSELYNFIEFDNKKCNYFYKLKQKKGLCCNKKVIEGKLYCKEHDKSIFIDKRQIIYKDYFNEYFNIRNYINPKNNLLNTKSTLIICPSHLCDQWVNEFYNKCNNDIKSKKHVLLVTTYNQYYNLTVGDVLFSDIVVISYNFLINVNYKKNSKKFNKIYENNNFLHNNEFSFNMFHWHRIIFEEFHEIRNMNNASNIENSCYSLQSNFRWNISGTPFANGISGFTDSLKLNTSLKFPYFENTFEINLMRNLCYYGLNTNLIKECGKLFKRNTKESVKVEYGGNVIKNTINYLTFTEEERNIYDSHLNGYNNKYSKFLLQLCCHPELYSETKQLVKNCKTLYEIQNALLKHHEFNAKNSNQKMLSYKNEIDKLQQSASDSSCTVEQQRLSTLKRNLTNEKKNYDSTMNTLNYLKRAIENIKTKDTCPICLDGIDKIAITTCGHKFCWSCFEQYSKLAAVQKCPSCNTLIDSKNVYLLNEEINKNYENELVKLIDEIKSTKIGNIIHLIKNDSSLQKCKIIIFSQWDEILCKVGEYIQKYNINILYCKGSVYQKKKCIKLFSEDDNYNIILLSSQNAASGINLTKANKIIFVESIIGDYQYRTNIENQAIGRSARIGNNQEIEIIKFIINDTIEYDIQNNIVDDKYLSKINV